MFKNIRFKDIHHRDFNSPYDRAYTMWKDKLLNIVASQFIITGNRIDKLFSTELMLNLCESGQSLITEIDSRELFALPSGESLQSPYYFNQFSEFTFSSPEHTGERKNGVNGAIVYALPTHAPLIWEIEHVAQELAHLDVTLKTMAINLREEEVVYTASTTKGRVLLEERRKSLIKGKYKPIYDAGFTTLKPFSTSKNSPEILKAVLETRENLLDDFYNSFGIKTSTEKKGNMIVEEVNANDDKLQFNAHIILEQIQKGLDIANVIYKDANLKVGILGGVLDKHETQ